MSSSKKLVLRSSDGETFEVEVAVALESQTIKHVVEDCDDNDIPLPNVNTKTLAKVIEYCKKHAEAAGGAANTEARVVDEELKSWDANFVKVDQSTLLDLIRAADYLNIKSLLDLTWQTVVDMIKGKTPKEIRKIFNIKNDFTMSSSKKIVVKSSDGVTFEVEEAVVLESQTIKHVLEDCADNDIPLPNVNSKTLAKVIEYCKKHAEAAGGDANTEDQVVDEELKSWDANFVEVDQSTLFDHILAGGGAANAEDQVVNEELKSWDANFVKVDQSTLFDLILAANFLNIKSLLDLTCQTVADMIKGKTPWEIRKNFNMKYDFTPEEEEEVRRENQWAFE